MSIPATYVSDRQVYKEFTSAGQPVVRNANRFFVEKKEDGQWALVEPSDRFVSNDELGRNFGLWKDERITTGHLWWKKEQRPLNGTVEADEVVPMADVMKQQFDSRVAGSFYPNSAYHDYDRLQPLKTELTLSKEGNCNLHTDWKTLYRHCENSLYVNDSSYLV
ncbi:MAG: hypothetical protein KF760_26225 [Candidatus Eremiobacteraeota bacterium]|nr:hypothetical protein [Candidatus Eremiobacteraeota bacterium]MCW5869554.1 hypothetical protein [Candidatus Eremiobacteraeota bacterium]